MIPHSYSYYSSLVFLSLQLQTRLHWDCIWSCLTWGLFTPTGYLGHKGMESHGSIRSSHLHMARDSWGLRPRVPSVAPSTPGAASAAHPGAVNHGMFRGVPRRFSSWIQWDLNGRNNFWDCIWNGFLFESFYTFSAGTWSTREWDSNGILWRCGHFYMDFMGFQ